jgi:hypothetical protein
MYKKKSPNKIVKIRTKRKKEQSIRQIYRTFQNFYKYTKSEINLTIYTFFEQNSKTVYTDDKIIGYRAQNR